MMRRLLWLILIPLLAGWSSPQADPQAAALLPEYQADLAGAKDWDRYTIGAAIDPQRQTLTGRLTLVYTNRDSVTLDRVYFRLFPNLRDFAGKLDITSVSIAGRARKVVYEQSRYLLRVDLPQKLAPQQTTTITLEFRTTVPANAGSKFYGAFNLQNSVLAMASAYPIAAMVRNGSWDIATPDVRGDLVNSATSLYDVTLSAPVDWQLVTTGSAIDRQRAAGRQTVRFVSGPQRDFMIVATKLASVAGDAGGTRVVSFYRAGNEAGGRAALRAATNALKLFSERFGRYPLTEFEIVPVDAGSFAGVEYPGMTLIEQQLYRGNQRRLEITIAHEVAHQWWYSLVGNNVQTEAWVDEAFASYSQVIYAGAIDGDAAAEEQLEGFRRTFAELRRVGRDAVVSQPSPKIRSYYGVVYAKGALFFEALRLEIGDEAFDRFLKGYYSSQRYRVATGRDLLASAEAACTCELDTLYRDWIETTAPVAIP
jgi:aminopeptidase N